MHRFDVEDKKSVIRRELTRLAEQLGRTPTQKEYRQLQSVGIGIHQITYLYGDWSSAVIDAGLTPNPSRQPPNASASEGDLIDEFVRVCNELGEIPGTHRFRSLARFSWTPYKTKWGSWAAAKEHILKHYPERFHFDVATRAAPTAMPAARKPLRIDCAVLYEPTNEIETIALFCLLCPELGYRIRALRASFPDGILEKEGQEVLVEFEYLSSNYLQHCHPNDFDGICICWRRDAELSGMEVFSIEEYLRSGKRRA